MDQIPFPEDSQLCSQLRLDRSKTPAELCHNNNSRTTLPGQPRVQLDPRELESYLREELLTPQLDQLAPKLWLVCPNPHHKVTRAKTKKSSQGLHASKLTYLAATSSGCSRPKHYSYGKPTIASMMAL